MWVAYMLLLIAAIGHGIIEDVNREYDELVGLTSRQLRDLYYASIVVSHTWTLATAYKRHALCAAIKCKLADNGEKL